MDITILFLYTVPSKDCSLFLFFMVYCAALILYATALAILATLAFHHLTNFSYYDKYCECYDKPTNNIKYPFHNRILLIISFLLVNKQRTYLINQQANKISNTGLHNSCSQRPFHASHFFTYGNKSRNTRHIQK